MISPLAHIDPSAKIGKNVTIHPFAYIDKNVEIGDNCVIMPYVSIVGGTRMGKNNKVYQGAIIGADPQDFRWDGCETFCTIGDNNIIRELTIINRGIYPNSKGTVIGSDSFIFAESHIGHDTVISDKCVVGNGTKVAGDVIVSECVILSSLVVVNAESKIGRASMVKNGCRVSGNIPPYVIVAHNPITYFGVNAFTMRKLDYTEEEIDNVAKAYRHIYQCQTSLFNAIKRVEKDIEPTKEMTEIINFIRDVDYNIVASREHREYIL
ncbi:MAG: acyl-ACP--UDP-N-acetylglucosamine O-acyltransferase [Bacteroidales bacterium]